MAPIFFFFFQSEKLFEIKPLSLAVFCMAEKSARLVDSRPKMKKCNFSDSFFFGKLRLKIMVIKTSYAFSYLKTAYSPPNYKKVYNAKFCPNLKFANFRHLILH